MNKYNLESLPNTWRFCKLNGNKKPLEKGLPDKLYRIDEVSLSTRVKALGVLCGPASGGLLVIDVDGPDAEARLAELGTLPASATWTSGLPHRWKIAFQVPEEFWGAIRTTHLLRGVPGQEIVCKWDGQNAAVLGEHPDTGSYSWIIPPQEIAIAPTWLLELMEIKHRKNPDEGLVDAFLADKHNDARQWLKQIPTNPYAEEYHSWIKVGAALHGVSQETGVDLFPDWLEWSEQAQSFTSAEECETKWASFHRNGDDTAAAGIGSLVYFAKEAATKSVEGGFNFNVKELPNWRFVAIDNKYCHIDRPTKLFSQQAFNTRFKKLGVKKASDHVIAAVDEINWYPGKEAEYLDEGLQVLNIHRAYPKGKPGPVGLFTQLVEHFYPDEAEVLYDFMAFTLVYPETKINFSPYIVGCQGIGKNFMWEPLKQALRNEFHCIHNDYRMQGYNDYMLGRKLVIIDEPMNLGGSRFAIANELKGLIAASGEDDKLSINGKYLSRVEQVHLTNFVILTNFADAIKVNGERRFYPCFSRAKPLEGEFYSKFARWLSGGGGNEAVNYWLRQRDLSGFNPKIAPTSESSLASIHDESQTEISEAIGDFVSEYRVVALAECRQLVKSLSGKHTTDFITGAVIQELGFQCSSKRISFNRGKVKARLVYPSNMSLDNAKKVMEDYLKDHDGNRPTPPVSFGLP